MFSFSLLVEALRFSKGHITFWQERLIVDIALLPRETAGKRHTWLSASRENGHWMSLGQFFRCSFWMKFRFVWCIGIESAFWHVPLVVVKGQTHQHQFKINHRKHSNSFLQNHISSVENYAVRTYIEIDFVKEISFDTPTLPTLLRSLSASQWKLLRGVRAGLATHRLRLRVFEMA